MALPDEEDRGDEATVALPEDPAGSGREPAPAEEPTAVSPETPAVQAELPDAVDGESAPTPSAQEPGDGESAPTLSGEKPDDSESAPTPPAEEPGDESGATSPAPPPVASPAPSPQEPAPSPREPAPSPREPAPSPREPAPARLPGRAVLGRRAVLAAGAGVAAAAVVGGFAARVTSRIPETGGPQGRRGNPAGATTTPSRAPQATQVATPPVAVQQAPIFTLSEFRKATGAGPFPADAIALTIDDGPHPVWTPKILRLLDKYDVPAMFCMIGNQVLGHEDIAHLVTAAGHQLANHTWSHPSSLAKKPGDVVRREIARAQAKIQKTTGQVPKFFRSPGGDWSPTVLQQTAAAGLFPLDWTNDPKDWKRPGAAKIEHTMLAARPGQILLCHDGGGDRSQTYSALKTVLPQLKARGLRFVAL